jgi:hypothetical protein
MSYGKCWYSESLDPQSFFDVDHFRPKAEAIRSEHEKYDCYPSLAFSWENFQVRGATFESSKQGRVSPSLTCIGSGRESVNQSVQKYGLNLPQQIEGREIRRGRDWVCILSKAWDPKCKFQLNPVSR